LLQLVVAVSSCSELHSVAALSLKPTFTCVAKRYSAVQCVAVCCSVLQCAAVRCSVLQCIAAWHSALQCGSVLQYLAVCCSVSQCVAVSRRLLLEENIYDTALFFGNSPMF